MDQAYTYEIRVTGHLTEGWTNWFEGLALHNDSDGNTTLRGPLTDQAALFSVLNKIQALNLELISVTRLTR